MMNTFIELEAECEKILNVIGSYLQKSTAFEYIPEERLQRYSEKQKYLHALRDLPDSAFYYMCGILPGKHIDTVNLEEQNIARERAWHYVRKHVNPRGLLPPVLAIYQKLERLNAQPQNKITNDFTPWDMEALQIPDDVALTFYPKMGEIIQVLLEKDFNKHIDLATHFNASIFKTVDRLREAVSLVAESVEGRIKPPSVLKKLPSPENGVFDHIEDKWLHRVRTALDILTQLPKGHAILDEIQNDVEKTVGHLYAHIARETTDMKVTKTYADRQPIVLFFTSLFLSFAEDGVSTNWLDQEITDITLNVRYVLDKTTDIGSNSPVLCWYDEYMGLTDAEEKQYETWEDKRRALGRACIVPGDGFSADMQEPLNETAQNVYKSELAEEWGRHGLNGIFDVEETEIQSQAQRRAAGDGDWNPAEVDDDILTQRVVEKSAMDFVKDVEKGISDMIGCPDISVEAKIVLPNAPVTAKKVESFLPSLEWRFGRMVPEITDLQLLYLMGVLTKGQYDRVRVEEKLMHEAKVYPGQCSLKQLVQWMRKASYPVFLPTNDDVRLVTEQLHRSMILYYNRFYANPLVVRVPLGVGALPAGVGPIDSLREKSVEMEERVLMGLTAVLATLDGDKTKKPELHQILDCFVREYYSAAVESLTRLSELMSPRQKSQIAVALPAFRKFQDRTIRDTDRAKDYLQLLTGIRELIPVVYEKNEKLKTAALREFNTWIKPLEEYWGLRKRHKGQPPRSNGYGQDGMTYC